MDLSEKIAKKVFTHKTFLNTGFNLLASAAVGMSASALTGHSFAVICGFVPFFVLPFSGNGINYLTRRKLNNYINFQKSHPLDTLKEFNNQPENIRSFIRYTMLCLLSVKYDPFNLDDGQILSNKDNESAKYIKNLYEIHYLPKIWEQVKDNPIYNQCFLEVYKDFKHDALLGVSLVKNQSVFFSFLAHGFKNKLEFAQEDLNYLKHKSKANLSPNSSYYPLYTRKCYTNLPSVVRDFVLAHTSEDTLDNIKEQLRSFEKDIQKREGKSLLSELEEKRAKEDLEKTQNKITNTQKLESSISNIHAKSVDEAVKDLINKDNNLNHDLQDKLLLILNKAKSISNNYSLMNAENAVEFKNLMELSLPKYLQIFAKTKMENAKELEFNKTLVLIEKFLISCEHDIENNQENDFQAFDGFLKNKLNRFNDVEIQNQHTQTLKMK